MLKLYYVADYDESLAWLIAKWPVNMTDPDKPGYMPDAPKPYFIPGKYGSKSTHIGVLIQTGTKIINGKEVPEYGPHPTDKEIMSLVSIKNLSMFSDAPGTFYDKTAAEMEALFPKFLVGRNHLPFFAS